MFYIHQEHQAALFLPHAPAPQAVLLFLQTQAHRCFLIPQAVHNHCHFFLPNNNKHQNTRSIRLPRPHKALPAASAACPLPLAGRQLPAAYLHPNHLMKLYRSLFLARFRFSGSFPLESCPCCFYRHCSCPLCRHGRHCFRRPYTFQPVQRFYRQNHSLPLFQSYNPRLASWHINPTPLSGFASHIRNVFYLSSFCLLRPLHNLPSYGIAFPPQYDLPPFNDSPSCSFLPSICIWILSP